MRRISSIVKKDLSLRISLLGVLSMGILLMASLILMLHFSRKAVKEDAIQKATQTLDGTIENIDNILLSVEQTTGNIFFGMKNYKDQPEKIKYYSQKITEANPYVDDCTISFDETYTSEPWVKDAMTKGRACWKKRTVSKDGKQEAVITYILPIRGEQGMAQGVIAVDVSQDLLSSIVLAAKPSTHSYCALLDGDGSFIVHPDSNKLENETVFEVYEHAEDPQVMEAAQAMVAGESGYRPFSINGTDYYVFYKPFRRSYMPSHYLEDMKWSAGIIYPESDIFGDYNSLTYYVIAISVIGLLVLFLLSRAIIHRQLRPLLMLTEKAQSIAQGKYDEPIPANMHMDEIGQLQRNFQKMQDALAIHIGKLEELRDAYRERGENLRTAYEQAQKADKMKTAFLHNMTNQMIPPAHAINEAVQSLYDLSKNKESKESIEDVAMDIQRNGKTVTELLNNLLNVSDSDKRKEESYGC